MKIILSPTKSMKRKDYLNNIGEAALFEDKSLEIRNKLSEYDFDALKKMYKASDKIVENTIEYYSNPKDLIEAINLYDGLVFKQLKFKEYSEAEIDYLINHVNILSAMYGVLSPNSLINEYRLDYLMKYEDDLYSYWSDSLKSYFNDYKVIINLASDEYAKSVVHDNMINIHFLTKENKVQATAAKMARGDMLNYLVKNQVNNIDDLKAYDNLGYKLLEDKCDEHNIYFRMES